MPSLNTVIKQASRGADLYFVFRFLRLLTMDYKKTDAYKYKIIAAKGKPLRKSSELETTDEKASYTMLHRMVFKIRRLIEKVPIVGKSILLNYAAALFLLKEQNNPRVWTDENYATRKLNEFLENEDWVESAKILREEVEQMSRLKFGEYLTEDGHTDVASAKNQVKIAMDALQKMNTELSKLPDDGSLPTWWTNKVAIAVDKLDGMADYLDTQVEEVMMNLIQSLEERKMTDAEMDKREKIVLSLKKKKKDFKDRYGDDADSVMYATATKMAMKKEEVGVRKVDFVDGVTDESLWANIHKKRQRIKQGSGERMRKKGEKGAPTAAQMKRAKGEGVEEDAPTTSTAGVAGRDIGLTLKKKKDDEKKAKKARKQMIVGESVKMSRFAGKDVFIVDSDTYHACRLGKAKYHRYEKYVGKKRVGKAIREYGLKFPKRPIILQNGEGGPMLYLRYGRS